MLFWTSVHFEQLVIQANTPHLVPEAHKSSIFAVRERKVFVVLGQREFCDFEFWVQWWQLLRIIFLVLCGRFWGIMCSWRFYGLLDLDMSWCRCWCVGPKENVRAENESAESDQRQYSKTRRSASTGPGTHTGGLIRDSARSFHAGTQGER